MKVIFYWMGNDKKTIAEAINKIKLHNVDYELGPSIEEHNFLIKNCKFYKNSFEQEIYAYCSDVWRVYKLSKEPGIFLGTTFEVGDNFKNWLDSIKNCDSKTIIFKGTNATIGNSIIASTIDDNDFYKYCYEEYCKMNDSNIRLYPTGPILMSGAVKKFGAYDINFESYKSKDFWFPLFFPFARNKSDFFYIGGASWIEGKNHGNGKFFSDEAEKAWARRQDSSRYYFDINLIEKFGFNIFSLNSILKKYSEAKSKKEKQYFKKCYLKFKLKIKSEGVKIPINKKIFWRK